MSGRHSKLFRRFAKAFNLSPEGLSALRASWAAAPADVRAVIAGELTAYLKRAARRDSPLAIPERLRPTGSLIAPVSKMPTAAELAKI